MSNSIGSNCIVSTSEVVSILAVKSPSTSSDAVAPASTYVEYCETVMDDSPINVTIGAITSLLSSLLQATINIVENK